jgi:hypothetical protein
MTSCKKHTRLEAYSLSVRKSPPFMEVWGLLPCSKSVEVTIHSNKYVIEKPLWERDLWRPRHKWDLKELLKFWVVSGWSPRTDFRLRSGELRGNLLTARDFVRFEVLCAVTMKIPAILKDSDDGRPVSYLKQFTLWNTCISIISCLRKD